MALVHAHGPPVRNAGPGPGDQVRRTGEVAGVQAGLGEHALRRERVDERRERFVVSGVPGDEGRVDRTAADELASKAVEQGQVALGPRRQVQRGGHRGFRAPGIDHDDGGRAAVAHHALPHDRVGDAGVGADEDEHVAFLKVRVGERWRIETEGLLVRDVRRRHALPRVAVEVGDPEAELRERAEQRHFLGHDLAGAEDGDGAAAVRGLDGFKFPAKGVYCFGPVDRPQHAGRIAQQRGRCAVGRGERRERFPALRAGHAEIHRVVGIGCQVDRLALRVEVDLQRAAGAAEATDRLGGAGRRETRRHAAQAEIARVLHEFTRHRPGAGVQEVVEGAHGATPWRLGSGTPGILGASTARKNR